MDGWTLVKAKYETEFNGWKIVVENLFGSEWGWMIPNCKVAGFITYPNGREDTAEKAATAALNAAAMLKGLNDVNLRS